MVVVVVGEALNFGSRGETVSLSELYRSAWTVLPLMLTPLIALMQFNDSSFVKNSMKKIFVRPRITMR